MMNPLHEERHQWASAWVVVHLRRAGAMVRQVGARRRWQLVAAVRHRRLVGMCSLRANGSALMNRPVLADGEHPGVSMALRRVVGSSDLV